MIRVYHVQNEPNCKVKCFLEPDCVAYNYGKNSEGNLQCELCNKSHLQVPSNHVMVTPGFIFRPVAEVFVRVPFFSISSNVFKIRMKFNLRQLFLAVSRNCKRFIFSDCRSGIEMSSRDITMVVINANNGSSVILHLPYINPLHVCN